MATLKCSKCSAFYPASDSTCPSCSHPQGALSPKTKSVLKIGTIFVLAFGVFFWIFGNGKSNGDTTVLSDTAFFAGAISAVKANLKDPRSAEFGKIVRRQAGDEKIVACGTVNSNNSFGAYSGIKRFIYTHERSTVLFDDGMPDFSTAWQSLCM